MSKVNIMLVVSQVLLIALLIWISYHGAVCLQAVRLGKEMLQMEDVTFEMAEHCGVNRCSSAQMTEAVELVMQSRAAFVEKGKQCLGE